MWRKIIYGHYMHTYIHIKNQSYIEYIRHPLYALCIIHFRYAVHFLDYVWKFQIFFKIWSEVLCYLEFCIN